jgi:hypothetical protein
MKTGGPDEADWGAAVARSGDHRRKKSNNPHFDDCLIAPPYRSKKYRSNETTWFVVRNIRSPAPLSTIGPHDDAPPKTVLPARRAR